MKYACLAAVAAVFAVPAQAQIVPEGKESPEEIAKDASRDLKDNRFYNKPGATRAQYDADWQECRLIARGSKLPSGSVSTFDPAGYYASISPVGAAAGGLIGGLIAGAIAEGEQRRANRKQCLLIKGWRFVRPPEAQVKAMANMSDSERSEYLNKIVGAPHVDGDITELLSFNSPADPAFDTGGMPAGKATFKIIDGVRGKPVEKLDPANAYVLIGVRRNMPQTERRVALMQLLRYDGAKRDLVFKPKRKSGEKDLTTYSPLITAREKDAAYELLLVQLTPGEYVIDSQGANIPFAVSTQCFGAPSFKVEAGQIGYLTDASPFVGAKLKNGNKASALIFSQHLEDARNALATLRSDLAGRLQPVTIANGATYSCMGTSMTRYDYPLAGAAPGVSDY